MYELPVTIFVILGIAFFIVLFVFEVKIAKKRLLAFKIYDLQESFFRTAIIHMNGNSEIQIRVSCLEDNFETLRNSSTL